MCQKVLPLFTLMQLTFHCCTQKMSNHSEIEQLMLGAGPSAAPKRTRVVYEEDMGCQQGGQEAQEQRVRKKPGRKPKQPRNQAASVANGGMINNNNNNNDNVGNEGVPAQTIDLAEQGVGAQNPIGRLSIASLAAEDFSYLIGEAIARGSNRFA